MQVGLELPCVSGLGRDENNEMVTPVQKFSLGTLAALVLSTMGLGRSGEKGVQMLSSRVLAHTLLCHPVEVAVHLGGAVNSVCFW